MLAKRGKDYYASRESRFVHELFERCFVLTDGEQECELALRFLDFLSAL
jgi:hypothetical protein